MHIVGTQTHPAALVYIACSRGLERQLKLMHAMDRGNKRSAEAQLLGGSKRELASLEHT
jgi:hypothetical protein